MGIPLIQKARIGAYVGRKRFGSNGNGRLALALMLEPLFHCNLACMGCGKIAHPEEILKKRMSPEECMGAIEECGAPVVCIAGGEPLLHSQIDEITKDFVSRKKFVYLCTNALLVQKRIHEFTPSPYLTFNVHLDALNDHHDARVGRKGVFENAVETIRLLVSQGFRVTTNTTLFKGETAESAGQLFDLLMSLQVEGLTIASAFKYEDAPDQEHFFNRDEAVELFRSIFLMGKNKPWRFNHSSLYLDFLEGNQNYACTPWGNPTRNILGWQRPCYLINDGYEPTYRDLLKNTDWSKYGVGRDPRCTHCMLHSGFEPTAVIDSAKNPLKALKVYLRRNR